MKTMAEIVHYMIGITAAVISRANDAHPDFVIDHLFSSGWSK
jgi:hypothetical protein